MDISRPRIQINFSNSEGMEGYCSALRLGCLGARSRSVEKCVSSLRKGILAKRSSVAQRFFSC